MIYFRLFGNLGNLLFQYATAVSLGKGTAIGVTDSPKTLSQIEEYRELFKDLKVVSEPPPEAIKIEQFRCDHTQFPDPEGRDLFISGYFQSEQYFDKDLVYSLFRPADKRIDNLKEKYGHWLKRPNVTGISVRRGDYLKKAAWHPFVGEKYFHDCISRLTGANDFIVCSDGIEWCKRFFPNAFPDKNFLFVEGESVLDQLYIHTLCKNNIVSNSSFSWWGAWLGERRRRGEGTSGVTLAPSMWMGYAPKKEGADWSDIYFDGMEIIKNKYTLRLWLAAHFPFLAEKA
jgi:hypothetical protein